jgi:uncharacterized protein DUF3467
MTTPQRPVQPVLELPADVRPAYANLARIVHSPADIMIDFAHLMPGDTKARITSRVLLSPLSAKLLLRALTENLSRYEAAFGEIVIPASTLAEQLFKPVQPPDQEEDGEA